MSLAVVPNGVPSCVVVVVVVVVVGPSWGPSDGMLATLSIFSLSLYGLSEDSASSSLL